MFPAYTREPIFVVYQVVNTFLWLILAVIALWAGIGLLKLNPGAPSGSCVMPSRISSSVLWD